MYLMLYTGYGYKIEKGKELKPLIVQVFAVLDDKLKLVKKDFIKIVGKRSKYISPLKDSSIIEYGRKTSLLTRPEIRGLSAGWWGILDIEDLTINAENMKIVLYPEKWEFKVGWSTNAVKLGSNEYLVGWHGIYKETNAYLNGLAIVSNDGSLLAISDYLLASKELWETYGDRPYVIFGNGLIMKKDVLYWIGGVCDYAIGVYSVDFDKVMEKLKWIKG